MIPSIRSVVLASLVLCAALSACNSSEPSEPGTLPAAPVDAPVIPDPAPEAVVLPECETLADTALNDNGHADCRLDTAQGLTLDVTYTYTDAAQSFESGTVMIKVSGDQGPAQTVTEAFEFVYGLPVLADLNTDGRDDLLVPVTTGNVNTVWALWYGTDGTKPFTRLGEISGFNAAPEGEGMFSMSARSSAASWEVSHYIIKGGKLIPIATAMFEMEDEESGPDCFLQDDGGLAAAGLTFEEAETRYCIAD